MFKNVVMFSMSQPVLYPNNKAFSLFKSGQTVPVTSIIGNIYVTKK
jgi:hypothetical protein